MYCKNSSERVLHLATVWFCTLWACGICANRNTMHSASSTSRKASSKVGNLQQSSPHNQHASNSWVRTNRWAQRHTLTTETTRTCGHTDGHTHTHSRHSQYYDVGEPTPTDTYTQSRHRQHNDTNIQMRTYKPCHTQSDVVINNKDAPATSMPHAIYTLWIC